MATRLQPLQLNLPSGSELNPRPKLQQKKKEEELNLDELTQEDKFYLIEQIENNIQKRNARYNSNHFGNVEDETVLTCNFAPTPLGILNKNNNSFEIVEDCAGEDQEDDAAGIESAKKIGSQIKRAYQRRNRKG